MQSPLNHSTPPNSVPDELPALQQLFSVAQQYFQRQARQTNSSNLRRQLNELQLLHQRVLLLLPATTSDNAEAASNVIALQQFYQQPLAALNSSADLKQLGLQLNKQLQLQKTLLRGKQLSQHQAVLLHFTASLQIATDQLMLRLHP